MGEGWQGGYPVGSSGRVIRGNKVYENMNKTTTLKLHKGLFVLALLPRNKFTKEPKLHLTLQRLKTTHENSIH